MSRIGRLPVAIPAGVTVEIAENNKVTVTGPKGTLVRELPVEMEIKKEGEEVVVTRPNDLKRMKALHGLTRTLINNMVVEMIAVPSPPNTLGSSSLFAYTRRPGFEILLRPEITFSFLSAPYFNVMWIVLKHPSSTMSYFAIYPSLKRISAIAIFILDAGTSTVSCLAVFALRILVSISAIGSLIVI